MLHGIKKSNSRRPVVSKILEERLVRDKCGNCKKLFLAFRPNNHHDLKTCDDCLSLKKISEVAQENNLDKIEIICSEQVKQSQKDIEDSPVHLSELTKFADNEKQFETTEKTSENEITLLPCRLGSYRIRHQVIHNNYFLSIGDIVSLHSEGVKYYAQISIFIESVFCEKYAALIWLLPTTLRSNTVVGFDPFAFIYGPEDEYFYDVKDLNFVMHPPYQFYKRFIPPVPKNSDILGIKLKHKVSCKRKS